MTKKVVVYRQGDVNLLPIDKIPSGAIQDAPIDGDKTVLAYGEVTGHAHVLPFIHAKQYKIGSTGNQREFIKIDKETTMRHGDLKTGSNPDHAPIKIPAGNYEKIIAREATPTGVRRVVD